MAIPTARFAAERTVRASSSERTVMENRAAELVRLDREEVPRTPYLSFAMENICRLLFLCQE